MKKLSLSLLMACVALTVMALVNAKPAVADGEISIENCTIEGIEPYVVEDNVFVKQDNLVVKMGDQVLVRDVDYVLNLPVATYCGHKDATVEGIGKYTGYKGFVVEVIPGAPTLKMASASGNGISIGLYKGKGTKHGYELQVSEKSDFSSKCKSKIMERSRVTGFGIGDLKHGTKYYVRLRGYYEASGEKLFSPWSNVKTAKTEPAKKSAKKSTKKKTTKKQKCKVKAKDYVGTYYLKGGAKNYSETQGAYNLTIASIKNGKVTINIVYQGGNGTPIYYTGKITAPVSGKKATFRWKDSWDNEGKGTLQFVKKHQVKLKMIETKSQELNRYSLQLKSAKTFLYFTKKHAIPKY